MTYGMCLTANAPSYQLTAVIQLIQLTQQPLGYRSTAQHNLSRRRTATLTRQGPERKVHLSPGSLQKINDMGCTLWAKMS